MLRAQAFENLFTLVPILLVAVISIFLRARAARRRKQREEAAQGAPAQGAPARGMPSRPTEGTQPSGAESRTAAAGPAPLSAPGRGTPARGVPARRTSRPWGRPIPQKQPTPPARAAKFAWQRETAELHPEAEKRIPASEVPFTPQQPHRPQVTVRESYAYPPPLSLNDMKSQKTAAMQPQGAPVLRTVVGPVAQSRTDIVKETRDLRERMEARSDRRTVMAQTKERSSITVRLERLPPLKRAVIWAEILGPPGGRH